MSNIEPYENLANAIVIQACKDYRKAYKQYLRRLKSTDKPSDELVELEQFFRSAWFQTLTNADGEYLMDRIKKEVSA